MHYWLQANSTFLSSTWIITTMQRIQEKTYKTCKLKLWAITTDFAVIFRLYYHRKIVILLLQLMSWVYKMLFFRVRFFLYFIELSLTLNELSAQSINRSASQYAYMQCLNTVRYIKLDVHLPMSVHLTKFEFLNDINTC